MAYKIKTQKPKEKDTYSLDDNPIKETPFSLKEENEYDAQANDFLKSTNTKFTIKKIGYGKYFPDDKEERDIYRFTLVKDGKKYSGRFGQSIYGTQKGETPSAYDVLASLSAEAGDENESYEDFADTFGYDRDSYKGRKIHKLVLKERKGLNELYSEEELQKLGEIS